MKPAGSRQKGAGGEREFAALVRDELGVKLKRNLEQSRGGGYDLVPEPGQSGGNAFLFDRFAIECKRARTATQATIRRWWAQAQGQAEKAGKIPVLAYRTDRQEWRVMLPLDRVRLGTDTGQPYCVELCVQGFCYVVRESL